MKKFSIHVIYLFEEIEADDKNAAFDKIMGIIPTLLNPDTNEPVDISVGEPQEKEN